MERVGPGHTELISGLTKSSMAAILASSPVPAGKKRKRSDVQLPTGPR